MFDPTLYDFLYQASLRREVPADLSEVSLHFYPVDLKGETYYIYTGRGNTALAAYTYDDAFKWPKISPDAHVRVVKNLTHFQWALYEQHGLAWMPTSEMENPNRQRWIEPSRRPAMIFSKIHGITKKHKKRFCVVLPDLTGEIQRSDPSFVYDESKQTYTWDGLPYPMVVRPLSVPNKMANDWAKYFQACLGGPPVVRE